MDCPGCITKDAIIDNMQLQEQKDCDEALQLRADLAAVKLKYNAAVAVNATDLEWVMNNEAHKRLAKLVGAAHTVRRNMGIVTVEDQVLAIIRIGDIDELRAALDGCEEGSRSFNDFVADASSREPGTVNSKKEPCVKCKQLSTYWENRCGRHDAYHMCCKKPGPVNSNDEGEKE